MASYLQRPTKSITGTYTLIDGDIGSTLLCNSGSDFTITLPSATGRINFDVLIENIGPTVVFCNGYEISSGTHAHLTCDGAAWYVSLGGGGGGGGGEGGGHVIWDETGGSVNQRESLWFTGNVQVTDDSGEDVTVVRITSTPLRYQQWVGFPDSPEESLKYPFQGINNEGGNYYLDCFSAKTYSLESVQVSSAYWHLNNGIWVPDGTDIGLNDVFFVDTCAAINFDVYDNSTEKTLVLRHFNDIKETDVFESLDIDFCYQHNTKMIDDHQTYSFGWASQTMSSTRLFNQYTVRSDAVNIGAGGISRSFSPKNLTKFTGGSFSSEEDYIRYIFYVSNTTTLTHMWLCFFSGPSAGSADYGYFMYPVTLENLVNGWNIINIRKSEYQASANPDWDSISMAYELWGVDDNFAGFYTLHQSVEMIRSDPIASRPNPFQRNGLAFLSYPSDSIYYVGPEYGQTGNVCRILFGNSITDSLSSSATFEDFYAYKKVKASSNWGISPLIAYANINNYVCIVSGEGQVDVVRYVNGTSVVQNWTNNFPNISAGDIYTLIMQVSNGQYTIIARKGDDVANQWIVSGELGFSGPIRLGFSGYDQGAYSGYILEMAYSNTPFLLPGEDSVAEAPKVIYQQQWTDYPESPFDTTEYPYQCIDEDGGVYLFCTKKELFRQESVSTEYIGYGLSGDGLSWVNRWSETQLSNMYNPLACNYDLRDYSTDVNIAQPRHGISSRFVLTKAAIEAKLTGIISSHRHIDETVLPPPVVITTTVTESFETSTRLFEHTFFDLLVDSGDGICLDPDWYRTTEQAHSGSYSFRSPRTNADGNSNSGMIIQFNFAQPTLVSFWWMVTFSPSYSSCWAGVWLLHHGNGDIVDTEVSVGWTRTEVWIPAGEQELAFEFYFIGSVDTSPTWGMFIDDLSWTTTEDKTDWGHVIESNNTPVLRQDILNFVGSGVEVVSRLDTDKIDIAIYRWEPITDGDPYNPELLFSANGDIIMGRVP